MVDRAFGTAIKRAFHKDLVPFESRNYRVVLVVVSTYIIIANSFSSSRRMHGGLLLHMVHMLTSDGESEPLSFLIHDN